MTSTILKPLMLGLYVVAVLAGPVLIAGCEPKREKVVHQETQEEVVVEEGPVVE